MDQTSYLFNEDIILYDDRSFARVNKFSWESIIEHVYSIGCLAVSFLYEHVMFNFMAATFFFDLDDEFVSLTIKPGSTLMAARRIINILSIDFSIIFAGIYIIFEYSKQVVFHGTVNFTL